MTAKILCADIERHSGLVGGVWEPGDKRYIRPDQIIEPGRTICLSWQWISGFEKDTKINFAAEWDWDLPQDNKSYTPGGGHQKLIELTRDLMHQADFVVSWNGASFDVPHLRGAQILYDMRPPSSHIDIDLMRQLKGQTKLMYYRLGVVAPALGLEGKAETGGDKLWRDLRFGQGDVLRRARRKMKVYNKADVQRTTECYHRLNPWLKKINLPLYEDPDSEGFFEMRCSNCKSFNLKKDGWYRSPTRAYQKYECKDCGKYTHDKNSMFTTQARGI